MLCFDVVAIKYEIIVGLQTVALQLAQLKGVKKELENRRLDVDYYKGRLRASSTAVAIESANNSLGIRHIKEHLNRLRFFPFRDVISFSILFK